MKKHSKKTEEEKDVNEVEEEVAIEQESEIAILEKKVLENLDGWQRCQAEFENYKKRSAEARVEMIKYSTQNIVLQILPVIDNFHASTNHIPEEQKENPWVTGIMYIQRQLENVLTENGIEEIVVDVGDNFDPALHEAISKEQGDAGSTEPPEGGAKQISKIKQVLTKGYRIGERVIRAARVVVE